MNPRTAGIVALAGGLGWIGLVWLAIQLYGTHPPTAGFDLELLLRAGRDVAAGRSPYDPAMLAGTAPIAENLFYSYPPVVAQIMALFAPIPSPVMFVAWGAAAVAGLGLVARGLAARLGDGLAGASPATVGLVVIALAPLMFPFAIGLLFGNLDVFFPLLFGLVLIGVLPAGSTADASRSGIATTVGAIAKLHPASIGLWLLVRSIRVPGLRRAVAVAVVALVAILAASLAVGGPQPWLDYVTVVRTGSGADLVDPRNAAPAAQVALIFGGGGAGAEALARVLQIPVTILALVGTAVVAVRLADPVESLAWAAAASLIVLPVTWYHYPSALIPFAIVAVLRSRTFSSRAVADNVRIIVMTAAAVAAVAIVILPLLYVAIGLVLAAVRMSGGSSEVPERVLRGE